MPITLGKKVTFVAENAKKTVCFGQDMHNCMVFIRYYTEMKLKTVFFEQKEMEGGGVGRRPGFCDCGFCIIPYLLEDADVP